jgi:transposase
VNFGIILILILLSLAASVGIVYAVFRLAKMKNVFWTLIPSGGMLVITLLTLLIMKLAGATWLNSLVTFYIFQIPVIAGVLSISPLRLNRKVNVAAENEKQTRLQVARRIEAERRRQLVDSLQGFCCAESLMKAEGQREIVLMAKNGKEVSEIAQISGASEEEIHLILDSYERYASRMEGGDGTADLILTPEQEEDIVCRLANSVPYQCDAGEASLWDKSSARKLAANRINSGVSARIVSAYLRHWGFTVPTAQTIKARANNPRVKSWIVSDFEKIRKAAAAKGGEIIWIYTVPMEAICEISTYVPKNPVLLAAVTNDGALRFKVYDDTDRDRFSDFATALAASTETKLYAVVNEHFEEYMSVLGKAKRRALEEKIEFFECV